MHVVKYVYATCVDFWRDTCVGVYIQSVLVSMQDVSSCDTLCIPLAWHGLGCWQAGLQAPPVSVQEWCSQQQQVCSR